MTGRVDAKTLKAWLSDGEEIALLDVREYGRYGEGASLLRGVAALQPVRAGTAGAGAEPGASGWCCATRATALPSARQRGQRRSATATCTSSRAASRAGRTAGLHALCGRQRAEQGVRRAGGAGAAHAARHGRRAAGDAGVARGHGDRGRAHLRRVPEDEHSRRHLLPQRRAGAAHQGAGARPQDQDRRQLRRPDTLDHRRADADRFRRSQSGRGAGERHARMVPGGAEARERRGAALRRAPASRTSAR